MLKIDENPIIIDSYSTKLAISAHAKRNENSLLMVQDIIGTSWLTLTFSYYDRFGYYHEIFDNIGIVEIHDSNSRDMYSYEIEMDHFATLN